MFLSLLASLSLGASLEREVDLDELVQDTRAVVRGVVVEHETVRKDGMFLTTYMVEVEEVLAGAAPRYVRLTLPGGRHEGLVQRVAGVPLWDDGSDVVVFVPAMGKRQSLKGLFTVDDEVLKDPLGVRMRPAGFPRHLVDLEERLADLRPAQRM